jgi:predicted nucleic acid-binding Zn ribbon protein
MAIPDSELAEMNALLQTMLEAQEKDAAQAYARARTLYATWKSRGGTEPPPMLFLDG